MRGGWAFLPGVATWGILAASFALPVCADVATLMPIKDNTLFEDVGGNISDGAGPLFVGNTSQSLARRSVIAFDIGSALPAGSIVDSVRFVVRETNLSPGSPATTVYVHRVLRDWGEGRSFTTSGAGAPADTGDATWLHTFYPASLWQTQGGDFDTLSLAVTSLAGLGSYSWSSPALAASVQSWFDHPESNFGWLLQADEVTLSTARRLESRESTTSGYQPTLLIYYRRMTTGVVGGKKMNGLEVAFMGPNPFIRGTKLAFTLMDTRTVSVFIFDLKGVLVRALVRGQPLEPHKYEIAWDGRDDSGKRTPEGIYFLQVLAGGQSVTRKLCRLR